AVLLDDRAGSREHQLTSFTDHEPRRHGAYLALRLTSATPSLSLSPSQSIAVFEAGTSDDASTRDIWSSVSPCLRGSWSAGSRRRWPRTYRQRKHPYRRAAIRRVANFRHQPPGPRRLLTDAAH